MNFNISGNKKKNPVNNNLRVGLNNRASIFGNDSDDDDDDGTGSSNDDGASGLKDKRARVNKEVVAEQAALRKRAQAALQQHATTDLYDYDGVYDEIHDNDGKKTNQQQQEKSDDRKESRYISDLLKVSDRRKREREIIYDRKIILEQEQEIASEEVNNKEEKYVTAAYKRKLQERDLWVEEQRKQDELQKDISTVGNSATEGQYKLSSFVGTVLNRKDVSNKSNPHATKIFNESPVENLNETNSNSMDEDRTTTNTNFMEGFEQAKTSKNTGIGPTTNQSNAVEGTITMEDKIAQYRKQREEKIAMARQRFFLRHSKQTGHNRIVDGI